MRNIESNPYNIVKIPKKNGGFRYIYIPSDSLKEKLQSLLPAIKNLYDKYKKVDCDHAFYQGRNSVTNAQAHIKHCYVLSLDIKNFFESVTNQHLKKYLPTHILELTLVNNKLPQGFPTSPYLSNIAMIPFDEQLVQELNKINPNIVYTRYADDLTFSFGDIKNKDLIITVVIQLLRLYKFKLNKSKMKFQDKCNGRAIITGVGVSTTAVYPTRKTLKKIRAALHQNNEASFRGLVEWSFCKPPKQTSSSSQ
jgi:retron-type reverse transcriptase